MTCCLWQDLNGKQQDWEAVVLIPFMEEERLLAAMQPLYPRLTAEEAARISHGPMWSCTYSQVSQPCSHSTPASPLRRPPVIVMDPCGPAPTHRSASHAAALPCLSAEEAARNSHGPMWSCIYSQVSQPFSHSTPAPALRRQPVIVMDPCGPAPTHR